MSAFQEAQEGRPSRRTAPPPSAAAPATLPRSMTHVGRVLGVGFMFALFGLGSLFLILCVLPLRLWFAASSAPKDLISQRLMQRSLVQYCRIGRALGVFSLDARNAELLRTPGALVVANHPSLLDVLLILSHMPQADCVVKSDAWRNPFLRPVVQAAGYIPNDSSEALVELCSQRLRAGRSVVLFPEGSRSPREGLRPFRRGAAHILLASGRPAIPVLMRCDPPALKKGQPWYASPNAQLRFRLEVDGPQPDWTAGLDSLPRSLAARRVNERMRDYFERRLGQ